MFKGSIVSIKKAIELFFLNNLLKNCVYLNVLLRDQSINY